jgi:threonine aldolase
MLIDLRSDTVTKPTPAMRAQMAQAEVGDDVYGEDPTVNRLQERVADLLGKEAALFVPSGVMANQIALAIHTQPGAEVLVPFGAHCLRYESGAAAALAGVQLRELGAGDGRFSAAELEEAISPANSHYPVTRLVCVENTHNLSGGRVVPMAVQAEIVEVARRRGLALHLDGARLPNAHIATGIAMRELAAPFDTVSICLSKGLGAPVGSLLAGSRSAIAVALRRRKMLGGGMRQAGILAAAALYALDHHLERIAEDHAAARLFAEGIAGAPGLTVDVERVETNIVVWDLSAPREAAAFVERARQRGVLLNAMGPRRVRAVTHLDVDRSSIARAADIVRQLAEAG